MIKAILFDLDGTLIDTNELIVECFQHALKKHMDMVVPREDVIKTFGEPLIFAMKKYDEDNVDELLGHFRKHQETRHDILAKECAGATAGIEALREAGMKIALVTSKRRPMTERGLNLIGLYRYMDAVVAFEDTESHKPTGGPALKACELLGVRPEETIMVGDSHNDILCGKDAGCFTCLVSYTALPLEELMSYEPDFIIDSLSELVEICENINEEMENKN
ncbi:MAG TPA: pyrophosphatase PpaX [Clostridiaceae bacterium]|nr:pyrophosphatase PpaX [Clostridiaceae bacterium]